MQTPAKHSMSIVKFVQQRAVSLIAVLVMLLAVVRGSASDLIINEIMYHPLQPQFGSEPVGEEFIELFNKGTNVLDLTGWHFSKSITFVFGNVTLRPGAYLVISPDTAAFAARYPGVTNVIGNWEGTLSNNGETIELKDGNGNVVDSVTYGTQGDWAIRQRGPDDLGHRGWKWFAEADGLGKTMERRNPNLVDDSGQNWAPSASAGGTPGRFNSVLNTNIAPLILNVAHSPLVPASTQTVAITARLVDEQTTGISATLFWRVDAATPPPFNSAPMFDDGTHGDGAAGDGIYGAIIPAQANNSVVEFYIQASDAGARQSSWPRLVAPADDGTGPTGQVANALFEVDDNVQNTFGSLSPTQPVYKLIMTENERAELAGIPCSNAENSNAEMNGTWISLDGTGQDYRYVCAYRNRGHGSRCATPPNYRINFSNDKRWKGVTALNVNSVNTPSQVLGATLARRVGLPGADSRAAQVRVNNVNRASTAADMLGAYAVNEEMDTDWTKEHFPLDSGGNIYRAIRDIAPPDWVYRGTNVNSYVNTYFKTDNSSAYDWSDLIQLHRIVGTNDLFTTDNVKQVANVEGWVLYYAIQSICGNNETSPNTGYNDDYFLYRGVKDPRFRLIYYDNDTLLSGTFGARSATDGIFSAEASNGMGAMTTRFLEWPDFKPRYYAALQHALDTTFSQPEFDSVVDETLGTYPNTSTRTTVINGIKTYMNTRRSTIQGLINGLVSGNTNNPVATISGEPRSPSPFTTATLTVGGMGITAYKYKLNNGAYSAEFPAFAPINLSGLADNSTNTVYVIGRNSTGLYQDVTNATVSKTWVVKTSTSKVRLNEILARNDSAVNHNGTFPDVIELYNESDSASDVSGLRLTDNANNPNKFTFPVSTTIPARGYLVVYANDPDGTPGFHLGFNLGQDGASVYLYDRLSSGGQLLDSVTFGSQVADLSIGRFNTGDWLLCQPTFGATNSIRSVGDPATLKINEWLTSGSFPYVDDFIEIYNPNNVPVAMGGMYLTDEPIGAPQLHRIADLSFIGAGGHTMFIADGDAGAGANHLGFSLSSDVGEMALNTADGSTADSVSYGPQRTGISQGRCPDGSTQIVPLTTPTPGAPNLCPTPPPPPVTISVLGYTNTVWRYDQTNNYDGTNWFLPGYNDSSWASGRGVLARLSAAGIPTNTVLNLGRITYYFRTTFNAPTNGGITGFQITHYFDDGAIVYLNGKEAYRYNMPAGTPAYATLAASTLSGNPPEVGPTSFAVTNMVPGVNVLAVEIHQATAGSGDIVMGMKLDAIIVTNSATSAGLVINEVLANNKTVAEVDGSTPDWIELYNPSASAIDLGDMSLSDTTVNARRWVFPSPTILPSQGYLVVRFDSGAPVSDTNTGFGLKASADSVYLFDRPANGGGIVDFVTFGLQAADFSIGRIPSGSGNWVLTVPSGGAPNTVAPLGSPATLKINEWMAEPASGDDWFELYNPDPQPVAIGGFWFSDDLTSSLTRQKSRVPPLSFIGSLTNGYQQFSADNNVAAGADHVGFKLSGTGEAIGVSSPDGSLIDGITFGQQAKGVSQGRLPDGGTNIVDFPDSPSPGEANFLPLTSVIINEVLSHTDLPLEDAIELYNPTDSAINVGGWYLSDAKSRLKKFAIPQGITLAAGGYKVFYEYQFNGPSASIPFALSSAKGDDVYLSQSGPGGVLTGYRASVKFGAAQNGVSFGRFVTSVGEDFVAMSDLSFGTAVRAGDPTNQITVFRTGPGAANPYAKVGPIVVSEIMYHPPDNGTNDNVRDEFIEIANPTGQTVPLYDPNFPTNTWRLRDAVDFDFPAGLSLPPSGHLVIVSFDPATNGASLTGFQQRYGSNMTLIGPYSGKLANADAKVELYKPDPPQVGGPDDGFVPYVLVERVHYHDVAPWPTSADGGGFSLQRLNLLGYGNEPTNWVAGIPDPGPKLPPASGDTDGDGMPDDWEQAHNLNPFDPSDAALDADGDGVSNLQEYLSGTDPQDATSFLKINSVLTAGAFIEIRFTAVARKTYTLLKRDLVSSGSWVRVVDAPVQSVTQEITLSVANDQAQRFYRLVTPAIP